jgi:hypothetical protein
MRCNPANEHPGDRPDVLLSSGVVFLFSLLVERRAIATPAVSLTSCTVSSTPARVQSHSIIIYIGRVYARPSPPKNNADVEH